MNDNFFSSPVQVILVMALVVVGAYVAIKLIKGIFWALGRVFRGIGWFFRHIFEFIGGMLRDSLGFVGSLLAAIAYVPALGASVLFVRRSAALHYGRALRDEITRAVGCLYRLAIGHAMRLMCLNAVTDGIEQRVPEVMARAPGPDRPSSGPASFAGYRITGTLQGGGSGARLHLAEPDADRRRQLERTAPRGVAVPAQVVIKSFSLADGSTLPQIVRENRALAAARDLGLVLEHELTSTRFHYVMPYVPGEDLGAETSRLHALSGSAGLDDTCLRRALLLTDDLLSTLQRFHAGGLWHKDVKPGNVIVSDGHAHLVDFGLITPLASAMTLTTHGTEYFRDPEMVRLALKGVKVHEVDGIKFDIYGTGAVLYSLVEGSFPAHGSLSRLTRRCPEALRWIIRRAMADMQHRYATAAEMLADLRVVSGARDPFGVRPADLPSLARKPLVAEALAQPIGPADTDTDTDTADTRAAAIGAGTSAGSAFGRGHAAAAPSGAGAGRLSDTAGPVGGRASHDGSRQARHLRPLLPPFGQHRWSRKAVAAAILAVLILGNFFFDSSRSRRPPPAAIVSSPTNDRPIVSSVEGVDARQDSPRLAAGTSGDGDVKHAAQQGETIEMLEPVSLEARDARLSAPQPRPLPPAGLVLVVDDLPANASLERVTTVEAMRTRLRDARYALIGCPLVEPTLGAPLAGAPAAAPGPDAGAEGSLVISGYDPTAEIELLAGARAAVGLSDPSDPEAVQRLSEFLKAQGERLDAILWIGCAGADAPIQTRIFARNDATASVVGRLLGGRRD